MCLKKKANLLVAEWSDNDDKFGAKFALERLADDRFGSVVHCVP